MDLLQHLLIIVLSDFANLIQTLARVFVTSHPVVESSRDTASFCRYQCNVIATGALEIHPCNWLYVIELWGCTNCNSESKKAISGKLAYALLCAEFWEKNIRISNPKSKTT